MVENTDQVGLQSPRDDWQADPIRAACDCFVVKPVSAGIILSTWTATWIGSGIATLASWAIDTIEKPYQNYPHSKQVTLQRQSKPVALKSYEVSLDNSAELARSQMAKRIGSVSREASYRSTESIQVGSRVYAEYHGTWFIGTVTKLPVDDLRCRYAVQCDVDEGGTWLYTTAVQLCGATEARGYRADVIPKSSFCAEYGPQTQRQLTYPMHSAAEGLPGGPVMSLFNEDTSSSEKGSPVSPRIGASTVGDTGGTFSPSRSRRSCYSEDSQVSTRFAYPQSLCESTGMLQSKLQSSTISQSDDFKMLLLQSSPGATSTVTTMSDVPDNVSSASIASSPSLPPGCRLSDLPQCVRKRLASSMPTTSDQPREVGSLPCTM